MNLVAAESAQVGPPPRCSRRENRRNLRRWRPARPDMPRRHAVATADINPQYLQKILLKTYERAPEDFETLLGMEGVGAKTLRALALTSELIYGTRRAPRIRRAIRSRTAARMARRIPSIEKTYDKTLEVMRDALNAARVGRTEKIDAFRRLARFGAGA